MINFPHQIMKKDLVPTNLFKASGHEQSATDSWNQVEEGTTMKNIVERKANQHWQYQSKNC